MVDFAEFPTDVLLGVFQHLNWRDLLAVRQVCQSLNAASRIRAVWTSQYQDYVSQKKFRPLLEEPLTAYTSEELEVLVIRRINANETWTSDECCPKHERWFTIDDLDERWAFGLVDPIYLVRGGRWLLVTVTKTASILVYDLDRLRPEEHGKILIPPRGRPIGEYQTVVDVDETSSRLALKLATYPSDRSTSDGGPIMIWSVILQGHGAEACLEAHLLGSFHPISVESYRLRASLRGNLFARTFQPYNLSGATVEVYDWTLPTPSAHRKAITVHRDSTAIQTVQILPGNRVAAFSNTAVYIFNIESHLFSKESFYVKGPSSSQYELPLLFFGPRLDDCIWMSDDAASYVILPSGEESNSSGLAIPHHPDKPPKLVELKGVAIHQHWTCKSFYFGVGKSVIDVQVGERGEKIFDLVASDYTWDTEGNVSISSHRLPGLNPVLARFAIDAYQDYAHIKLFDEESGRAILCFDRKVVVLDFSCVPLSDP